MSDEGIRDRVVARLNQLRAEAEPLDLHVPIVKTAAFPPFAKGGPPIPPNGGGVAGPPGAGTGMNRDIPPDHPFNPKALRPLSKSLWASSVALGHALTAYRFLSRLKSPEISPDGRMGGRGYVMEMQAMRQKLYDACEALSAISDTLHDEIHAPHWKPRLAQLDDNTKEDVERFIEESQNILANPEEDAEEEIEEIEKANDGKGKSKSKDKDKEPGSEIPDGGRSTLTEETQNAERTPPKEASFRGMVKKAMLRGTFTGDIQHEGNSSLPVGELPGGPRVQHIDPEGGPGPYGAWNDEPLVHDEWSEDEGGAGRRNDSGEDYDYPNEWENEPAVTATKTASVATFEDLRNHWDDEPTRDGPGELITEAQARARSVAERAEKLSESLIPDHNVDDAEGEAWDFGLGYGAKGQGAGGYPNPSGEGGGRGVEGPASDLPSAVSPPEDDTTPMIDVNINERGNAWASLLPNDEEPPVARSDYYKGDKGNVVNGLEFEGDSELPGDETNTLNVDRDLPGRSYTHERLDSPYVKYDYTTKQHRPEHQHGRPEELPFAQDGEATR